MGSPVVSSFEAAARWDVFKRCFLSRRILPHRPGGQGADGPEDRRIAAAAIDSTLCRNNTKHRSR